MCSRRSGGGRLTIFLIPIPVLAPRACLPGESLGGIRVAGTNCRREIEHSEADHRYCIWDVWKCCGKWSVAQPVWAAVIRASDDWQ